MNTKREILTDNPFKLPVLGAFEPHSAEWHEARNGKIGGSSVGAILGLSPFRSAMTEYYIATGEYTPDMTPSMSMRLGTKLEAPILDIFCEEHPELEVFTTPTYGNEWATLNLDGVYKATDGSWGLIEVKYSRDYMTEIPPHYRAQMVFYMGMLGIEQGILVALAGSTYVEHEIRFNQFEFHSMLKQLEKFRHAVATRTAPEFDNSSSTYETIRAMNTEVVDERVDLGDLGVHLFNAHKNYKEAEAHFTEMKSRTLAALGSARVGVVDDTVVCIRQQRGNYAPSLIMKGSK